jgi:thioesterase domain-containing protein
VTVLNLPTAFWHYLVHSGLEHSWPRTVRLLVVGGESVSRADLRLFRRAATGHIRFLNGYGPTEATITSTVYDDAECDDEGETVPIGRPLDGCSHFVLDRHLRPMPPGAVGQLYIGGAGLALGYLRREELTAERFLPHPFRVDGRLYATGDLVRLTDRGNYVYVGRVDDQVKLRGYRIELGEVEACLTQHPDVAEAVVLLYRHADVEPELRAFIVPRQSAVSADTLHDHVSSRLPTYMVPRLMLVDGLPKTVAGKTDRHALEAIPFTPVIGSDAASVTAEDPLERQLLQIWTDLLGSPVTDKSTNFFEVGGHSLLVLQMLRQVEVRLERVVNPRDFLRNPTIGCLACLLRGGEEPDSSAAVLIRLSQGNSHLRPLFLAPNLAGLGAEFANLGKALHPDIPVYAIQHRLRASENGPAHDLTTAARHYAGLLRAAEPQGPYAIAGYSAGGIVALAIAESLHAVGAKTDFVGLIDSTPPATVPIPLPVTPRRFVRLCRTIIARCGEVARGWSGAASVWARIQSAVFRSLTGWFPAVAWRKPTIDDVLVGGSGRLAPDDKESMQLRLDAALSYELGLAPIDVVLFRTIPDPLEGPHEPDLGWRRAVRGRVKIEHVPGAHEALLTAAGVSGLAVAFDSYLRHRVSSRSMGGWLAATAVSLSEALLGV